MFEEQKEGYFRETRGIQKTRGIWRQEDTEQEREKPVLDNCLGMGARKERQVHKIAVTEIESWDVTKSGFRWLWKEQFLLRTN